MAVDERSTANAGRRTADDIDGAFVPRGRDDAVGIEIDGETVLVEGESLSVQHLDRIATVVWSLFDGSASVDEIGDACSEAFAADPEVVRGDVLALARTLGRRGLLDGIDADPPPPVRTFEAPAGVPVGGQLPAFRQPDLDGVPLGLDEIAGTRVLLVNWSPTCGHCSKIASELADLEPALAAAGVRPVLLAHGSVEANRDLVERVGLMCTVLVRDGIGDDDPFAGMGTPIAYLLDVDGTVQVPMAVGSVDVPQLARDLAAEATGR